MNVSYSSTRDPCIPTNDAVSRFKLTHAGKCLLLAIPIIILVGSIVATGCLYGLLGNWSLGIGGAGLFIASVLTAAGLLYNCKTSSLLHTTPIKRSLNKKPDKPTRPVPTRAEDLNKKPDKPTRPVPTRAEDIVLSGSLPKVIPEIFDVSGKNWARSEILFYYIQYLSSKFSDLLPMSANLYTTKTYYEGIDGLDEYIFEDIPDFLAEQKIENKFNIPVYVHVGGNHWTLLYIDKQKRTLEYYDSLLDYGNQKENITEKLQNIAVKLSEKEPKKRAYTVVWKMKKKLQMDGHHCGVWVLYFLEYRLTNPDFDFNTLDANKAKELIEKYKTKVMLKLIERYPNL